jgi:peptidylprolyl isomerase
MLGRTMALTLLAGLGLAGSTPAQEPEVPDQARRTLGEVLEASSPSDWRTLEPANTLYLELPAGRVVIELAPWAAPRHIENIRTLVRDGHFDGGAIVRSQDNYVVQWQVAGADEAEEGEPLDLGDAATTLPPAFQLPAEGLPFTPVPDPDAYAPAVGFTHGFPVGRDPAAGTTWLAHCYGVVGIARGEPGTGNGSSLYVVIGHAPRHLDRNLTMAGRVVAGIEHLSTLPRGTAPLGFYDDPARRVPIRSARLGAQLAPADRVQLELLRTDTPTFEAVIAARRHRGEDWFVHPTDRIGLCNVPLPVRGR